MKVLFLVHIGETIGHLVRALSIADELSIRRASIVIACSPRGKRLLNGWHKQYAHYPVTWSFSHNSCSASPPVPEHFYEGVRTSLVQCSDIIDFTKPDCVIGCPGIFTAQLAKARGVRHFSILHAPYVAPITKFIALQEHERSIVNFARSIFIDGVVDSIYERLSSDIGMPSMSYIDYLINDEIFIAQGGIELCRSLPNIHRVNFIRGSYGPPYESENGRPQSTCYITFGSGNPCPIGGVISACATVFEKVIVSLGQSHLDGPVPKNVEIYSAISSASLAGRVSTVISHGGIGTVGTFAEQGVRQVIIPTELDQAMMAIHARLLAIALPLGLESWAQNPRLGRRLPDIRDEELQEALLSVKDLGQRIVHCASGAQEIAEILNAG